MEDEGTCGRCGGNERYSNGQCKPCALRKTAAYRQQNKERVREYNKAWNAANKVRKAENDARYRRENKERVCEQHKTWLEANKKRRAEQMAAWRAGNKGRLCEYNLAWNAANAERVRETNAAHATRKRAKKNLAAFQATMMQQLSNTQRNPENV